MSAPVVVAVDGTADGRRALHYGVELATTYGAPLRLVHVRHENIRLVTPMMPLFPDPALDQMAARVLHEALADARRMGWAGDEPETVLARAPRVPALVDHSDDARCIVVGRRSSTPEHLLTGSTTNGLAAHSAVPVVCVPESWDPEVRFHQVAVGVDCTERSAPLVEAAAAMAHHLDAHVTVMHAWRPVGLYDAAISGRAYEERWEQETRPLIDTLVDPARARHPEVKIDVVLEYDRPVVALHELARVSDLLVIGRHGDEHSRFTPALGSTARTVLRTSQRPVVVVPVETRAEQ
jgi:nucleotide-binding universal stress UspA family protein